MAPERQEIWTAVQGVRDTYAFSEQEVYLEQPLGRRLGLVIQPRFDEAPDISERGWRAEAGVALKAPMRRTHNTALALQLGTTWTSEPAAGCQEGGGEARILGGAAKGRAFVNLEAAYRLQSGGCAHNRVDFTAGYKPDRRWMGLAQVFADDDLVQGSTVKIQASIVRFTEKGNGLQIGLRVRASPDGGTERALVAAWWPAPETRSQTRD